MLRATIATRAVLFSPAVIANLVALEAVTFNFGSRPAGDESDLLKLNFHYRPGEVFVIAIEDRREFGRIAHDPRDVRALPYSPASEPGMSAPNAERE
jgi:hypothetical protein